MAKVSKSARIGRPAGEVWALIRGFNDLPKWLPGGATSTMEGEGVGAVRTLVGHGRVKERLDAYDEAGRTFSYSIVEGTLPVAGYASTMRVIAEGDDACIVEWWSTFEPDGAPEAEVVADIEALYDRGLAGIKDTLVSERSCGMVYDRTDSLIERGSRLVEVLKDLVTSWKRGDLRGRLTND